MKSLKQFLILTSVVLIFFSCNRNPLKVDISGFEKDLDFVHFNKLIFEIDTTNILNDVAKISNEHSDFFNLFTYKMIRIGGVGEEDFSGLLKNFLQDTMIINVRKLVDTQFQDFSEIEKEINTAFKYFQYHFPKKELPTIYTTISGFNQSVVTAEGLIGISLDKYLGKDCAYYKMLSTVPMYKTLNMHKNKIASDVAYAWGITEFDESTKTTNLLSNMISQGKLMYFVDALLPEMHDSLKIGYTGEKLEWCYENEAQMWLYLVERKLLYSNQRMDILRYINDGPSTTGFPIESPSRTGIWIGWQIVRQYMKKNPEITLPELMTNDDYQGILNASGYFPE